MHLEKLTIVGAGLIGGSLGLAAKERELAKQVTALVRRPQSVEQCQALGIAHDVTLEATDAIADADLIVLCTPVASMIDLVKSWLPVVKVGAVVTDVGSTKRQLVNELTPIIAEKGAHFVGSHPMAGSAQTGPSAARADLFEGSVCVVTPGQGTDSNALKLVNQFWEDLGSQSIVTSVEEHDQLVARCSQLPHLLSSVLAKIVLSPRHGELQRQLCATGFRDMSRLASGSPVMWRDIVISNREAILGVIDEFFVELEQLKGMIKADTKEDIQSWLSEAKRVRDDWRNPDKD
ncbi:MAG: prephenate dehydrogenase/arogenate dehydrogenase family protein [Verrucomicrobiota bacterium]|nr:prephenate dehydrogenase/arogenate dehydrogenase family protein [Verrucomicrobiota bacterium]